MARSSPAAPAVPWRAAARQDVAGGWRVFSRAWESLAPEAARRPPVVLVHGLGLSSVSMVPTARALASRFNVYAPDLPGYGRSQKPPAALPIDRLAGMLEAWMDRLNLSQAVLAGNSLGCQFILDLALRSPDRACAAVLVGPSVDPAARSYPRQILRGALQLLFEPPTFLPVMLPDYLAHGLRRNLQSLRYAFADPVEEKLPRLAVPTLVVRGQRDRIISQAWAEEVARRLPRSRLVVLPGAGHVATYDSGTAVAAAVDHFINASGVV